MELTLIKKNRIWFDAVTSKGYKCKLKIDDNTKDLELKEHDLFFKDISVRTKYGTDLKFELPDNDSNKIVTLSNIPFNKLLVARCKELGGEWDREQKAWLFPGIVEDEVEELEYVFGRDFVDVEITSKDEVYECCDEIAFLGYPICRASGRDSGAELCKGISLIKGSIDSRGSIVNWRTSIKPNSTFRLTVTKSLLEDYPETEWEIKLI